MTQSRRVFLRALGAGVVCVSLPEVSSIFNLFSSRPAADDDFAATLRNLFGSAGGGRGGPFTASASTFVVESSPQRLLDSPNALMGVLDQLGVEKTFSPRVSYAEAAQCRHHFQQQEAEWRNSPSLGGEALYTDIRRSPADRDVAVFAGGQVTDTDNRMHHAEGSIQYQNKAAVKIAGRDPGAIFAASQVIRAHVAMSAGEAARTFALTESSRVEMDGGQVARRYETPMSAVVHIPRPRRGNRIGNRAVGVVAVTSKRDPDRIYFADLYE